MEINILNKLLKLIEDDRESFDMLVNSDNPIGLNSTGEEICNYLEFSSNNDIINAPIVGNILITDGSIFSIIKIIQVLPKYSGDFILYINSYNLAINSYLVSLANDLYKELGLNLHIKIDYNDNYNAYLNNLVNIIGSEDFVNTSKQDFGEVNTIIL